LGGDLMILLDSSQSEIVEGSGILIESGQAIFNNDGSLILIIGDTEVLRLERDYELPFFVETPYPCFRPANQSELWYIRCELRRTNTSNV
jgi:hypothetical protein